MPTEHQANSLPREFRDQRLHVIHEGIDTQLAKPNPAVNFALRGITIDRSVPTITLVNRNLERLRGFDVFHACAPCHSFQPPACSCLDCWEIMNLAMAVREDQCLFVSAC